jgi:hypothetical protein
MHLCVAINQYKMLSKVSWYEFIWFLVFLVIPYYFFVLTVYFRKEVFSMIRNHGLKTGPGYETAAHVSGQEPQNELSLSDIHDLLEDLKKLFAVASKTKMVKEELVQAIHIKLKTYPNLEESNLREDISNHIKIEAKTVCGIALDAADLKQFWNP